MSTIITALKRPIAKNLVRIRFGFHNFFSAGPAPSILRILHSTQFPIKSRSKFKFFYHFFFKFIHLPFSNHGEFERRIYFYVITDNNIPTQPFFSSILPPFLIVVLKNPILIMLLNFFFLFFHLHIVFIRYLFVCP